MSDPRDLRQTLPGTGPIPLVDGDAVATILRDLVVGVDELGKGLHAKLDAQAVAQATPPSSPPKPRPSLPAAAAQHAVAGAKWLALAVGVLGIAAQIAKVWRPSLAAPLDQAVELLKGLTGQ
jgi:hypothetical protein